LIKVCRSRLEGIAAVNHTTINTRTQNTMQSHNNVPVYPSISGNI
jgi:hypothetical protein